MVHWIKTVPDASIIEFRRPELPKPIEVADAKQLEVTVAVQVWPGFDQVAPVGHEAPDA